MNSEQAFEEWYDDYFVGQQGEDSPYSYNDIKIAFLKGWELGKSQNKSSTHSGGKR